MFNGTINIFFLFADEFGPSERKKRKKDQGNTMADSESLNRFRDLKSDLNRSFDDERYYMIRFLLFDDLRLCYVTNPDFIGHDLLNALDDKGVISPTNVSILLEITKLSEIKKAEDIVIQYMKDNKVQDRSDTKLSSYRKRLFTAMLDIHSDAFKRIISNYGLRKHNFSNVWDAVLHLEIEAELADDPDKIKSFARHLGQKARDILLGNSEKK
ncbi:uncharacterized protein [Antedon mediterranea]|uniref:uncharacterized protein n=1 Tax=Antedon mediterranea TaxID=105859 RepID=UPI003AF6C6DA